MNETEMARRLRTLETRVDSINLGGMLDPNAPDPLGPVAPTRALQRQLQDAEVFVRKVQKRKGGATADTGVSTVSSACTSACFSSASTLCANGSLTAASKDPELAQVFATLTRRGIEVMGEEAFMDEIIKQGDANRPVNVFEIADGN